MITVRDVLQVLDQYAPFVYQEEYDNSGFQLGDKDEEVHGILLCLDLTTEIIDEAIQNRFNLILTHHPFFLQRPSLSRLFKVRRKNHTKTYRK